MYLNLVAIMEPRAPMFNKFCALICSIIIIGCGQNENTENGSTKFIFENVDVSQIPNAIVFKNDSSLKLLNGVYNLGGKPFSGFIKEHYENNTIKSIGSYLNGKQQGKTKIFFPNGKLDTERSFKNGKAYGKHVGFWENENKKFEFNYYNDKREGMQKQWYESGEPYAFLSFRDDQEEGMQRAWRINGKPYINYEVKDGIRYGLQKAALCYTLKDEKLK